MAEATSATAAEDTKSKGKTKAPKEPKKEKSIEELRADHEKLRAKEAQLLADLAIKEHPELEADIQTLTNYVRELQKSDSLLKAGADTNVQKERERLQKLVEHYQNKIASIQDQLKKADTETVVQQLQTNRAEALNKLGEAFLTIKPRLDSASVTVDQLMPTVVPYLNELKGK